MRWTWDHAIRVPGATFIARLLPNYKNVHFTLSFTLCFESTTYVLAWTYACCCSADG